MVQSGEQHRHERSPGHDPAAGSAPAEPGHDHAEHGHPHAGTGADGHPDGHGATGHRHDHGAGGHDHGPNGHDHGGLWGQLSHFLRPHSHDAADSVDDALEGSAEGIRAVKISLIGLGATAAGQLVIVLISNSVGLLSDTIHNFADASTALPLWLAFSIGRRPANRRYTYGYGRAEDLAGVFVVLMIAGSAALAAYESFHRLLSPQDVTHLGWVAGAGVVGFIGNELVAQYRIRVGERIGSAALIADGYHARTDGFTSLAVLGAAIGIWLGYPIADPIVGLLITLAILAILKSAVVQIWHRLMDAVDPAIIDRAEAAARAADGVEDVTAVRARWIGHAIHAEAHVTADRELSLAEAHDVAERARHAMLHAVPKLASATVHVDPCQHAGHDPHADLAHHDRRSAEPSDAVIRK